MAEIKASVKFDAVKGSATVTMEPVGTTELEHELMARFFTERDVHLVPFGIGDRVECRFVIMQEDAYLAAQRAVENRIRARDGRPSWEDERAAKNRARAAAGLPSIEQEEAKAIEDQKAREKAQGEKLKKADLEAAAQKRADEKEAADTAARQLGFADAEDREKQEKAAADAELAKRKKPAAPPAPAPPKPPAPPAPPKAPEPPKA